MKASNVELKGKNEELEQRLAELQREMLMHFVLVHGASGLVPLDIGPRPAAHGGREGAVSHE